MNTKYKDFYISNYIIIIFTILIILILNNFIIEIFGFNKNNFLIVTVVLMTIGVVLYHFLSKQLFEILFKSDRDIESHIKETLHELNTPVATIQMNTKILLKKEQNDKNINRLVRIEESCDNLLTLYNQMEYNIKEQIDKVNIESFEIDEVLTKSINKFQDIKNNIQIHYDTIDLIINTDKNGFERIINNLISNAIKYNNPNGTITIKMQNSILSIADTGIGIDTKSLFHIFDKYYQENNLNTGIGLGLNMVKAYCDKYKINIKIDSTLNKGSIFYLDLKGLVQ